jgi:hypothetical protein
LHQAVYLQARDAGSADFGQTIQQTCFRRDEKVLLPKILTRIKEAHKALGEFIIPVDVISLVKIAGATCEREVSFHIWPALRDRNYVFNFKRQVENGFGRVAVLASMPGAVGNRWVMRIH